MAMIYDITNDTPANEGNMAIIKPYNTGDGNAFRLSLAAINYKYGGGKYTFIIKDGSTDAGWVSFIMTEQKQSSFNPDFGCYHYILGGHDYYGSVIQPTAAGEDSVTQECSLGCDRWNGTAFTDNAKALLIKEWSI